MRLKLLFFPLMLLVSITLVLSFIVPQWEEIKVARKEGDKLAATLADMNQKSRNAGSLLSDIEKNVDRVSYAERYVPKNRSEERIIDSINYLSNGLILFNINLENVKEETPLVAAGVAADVSGNGDGLSDPSLEATVKTPVVSYTKGTILLSGSYESIMTFLSNLHNMEMLSSLDSVVISRADSTSQKAAHISTETAKDASGQTLEAKIAINFASLPMVNISNGYSHPLFLRSVYDFSTVDKLRENVATVMPNLEASGAGKANPFLP